MLAFFCVALLFLSPLQNVYSDNAKIVPEVLLSSGYANNSGRLLDVEFTIGDVFVGDGEYNMPTNSDNTLGLGFFIGDVISARYVHYLINNDETYTDTIIPGCDIVPFDAPYKQDSVFVGWYPSLPEVMPDKDLYVIAFYRDVNWNIVPSKKAFCPGEIAEFTIASAEGLAGLTEYKVEYIKEQLDGGFIQYGYERLDVYEDSVKFEIPIPADYIGDKDYEEFRVRFKYEDGHESSLVLFRCKINLPSSLLLSKYGEVVIYNNKGFDAKEVAWFKNGVHTGVFGMQYVEESKLFGEYSAVVRSFEEVEREVCSKGFYYEVGLEQGIAINPNPARKGEPIQISVKGFSRNQLDNAQLDVFDVLGSRRIMEVTKVGEDNYVTLSEGVYIVALHLATGKVYSLKFIVY
ncbi:MAG: hypothetical protein MJZ19_04670 [Paludibacteraceae bacterium]|nr:hypothetical protein [Paludibacteraceae bacterium]